MTTEFDVEFEQHRELLPGVAYRILGRAADADDVVQDAWLRWDRAEREAVREPRAFLIRTVGRLALDRLRRIKARREAYVGPWLPEPIATSGAPDERAEVAESVSMGMLVVLETLSPLERAVFVLREAFDLPFSEIADALGRTEPAVRQLAARARRHVAAGERRFDADVATQRAVAERFLAISVTGDLAALMDLLAPGVTLIADGGGRVRAPLREVVGADKVARFLLSVAAQPLPGRRVDAIDLNGAPAAVVWSGADPVAALLLDVVGGRVQTIYLVANPEKLAGVRKAA